MLYILKINPLHTILTINMKTMQLGGTWQDDAGFSSLTKGIKLARTTDHADVRVGPGVATPLHTCTCTYC